jgi:hypothetical protein
MKTATLWLLEGINRVWALRFSPLLCYYATLTAAATKTKPIGDDDDRQFTIIVNSASTAAPIGLPPKMAEFCHTSNRSLLGRQCLRALLRLYFNSSATGWRSVVGGWWSVGNKGCRALGGSLQKDKKYIAVFWWSCAIVRRTAITLTSKIRAAGSWRLVGTMVLVFYNFTACYQAVGLWACNWQI